MYVVAPDCALVDTASAAVQVDPDFSNFDDSMAWPLLLDNYVDWARSQVA